MNEPKKDSELVSAGFNERQSTYLQRLGLKTLLERTFPKSVTGLLKRFWLHRMTLSVFALGVYAVSASFTVASLSQELKESRYTVEGMRDADKEHLPIGNNRQQNVKADGLPFFSEEELIDHVLAKTGTMAAINEPITPAGGTILHASMMKNVSTQYLDFLIRNGADINAQRTGGETPLMVAINRGAYEQAYHLLLAYPDKIDLSIKNKFGNNLYQAVLRKHKTTGNSGRVMDELIHLTSTEF